MFEIKALANNGAELLIYGDIGQDFWSGDESNTAKAVVSKLDGLKAVKQLDVRINSFGGSLVDGLAIYNAIKRFNGVKNVFIDGVAMSAASLIAMAGDVVNIAENGLLMIHAPHASTMDGTAKEHRKTADLLDKFAEAMIGAYQAKSLKSAAEIEVLVKDGEDHFYTANEALAEGFVDVVVESTAMAIEASINRFKLPDNWLKQNVDRFPVAKITQPVLKQAAEVNMADDVITGGKSEPVVDKTDSAVQAAGKMPEIDLEAKRQGDIKALFAHLPENPVYASLKTRFMIDNSIGVEKARQMILDEMGKDTPAISAKATHIEDGKSRFIADATDAIMAKMGLKKLDNASNPVRSMRLERIAEQCLINNHVNYSNSDRLGMIGAAFTQSTSDFPVLLENVMHKTLLTAYAIAPDTWSRFCKQGTVSDFRAHNRYRTGSFGNLDSLNELGEYKNKAIPDGEKSSITASTKGNIINISRQAIINDDLNAFVGLAMDLARAAKRTVEADVYTLLASNPVLEDGVALFHSTHGNLAGTSAVVTMASIDAARILMASQKDISGNDYLDLRPRTWLGGLAQGSNARSVNEAQYDPDTANKLQKPNTVRGLFSDIVDTPRITGTEWYLFADPMDAPVIEVAFLDGNSEPYMEMQQGWNVDGSAWKVRLDYGIAAIDYRGAVKNAGSS